MYMCVCVCVCVNLYMYMYMYMYMYTCVYTPGDPGWKLDTELYLGHHQCPRMDYDTYIYIHTHTYT